MPALFASLRRRRRYALPAGGARFHVRVIAVLGLAVIPPGRLGRRSAGASLDVGHRLDGDGHRVVVGVGRRTPPAPAESDADADGTVAVMMVTVTAMPAAVAATAAGAAAGGQDLARERGLARR